MHSLRIRAATLALWFACSGLVAAPASAQELEDVLGDIGSADAVADDEAEAGDTGLIFGRVFDGSTGAPLSGASVILNHPDAGDGSEPRQEVQVTGIDGSYEFAAVPAGQYDLTFIKAGFRASTMTAIEVEAGDETQADFPLPAVASTGGEDVLDLDAFVVDAEVVGEMMTSLELRMESDQMLNLLSAEDLSRYAASDVADALKRVAGVNIVEGQFAIIRGLEDRYSSTLFNGAPVPSPDPDRQSVQLDLFPSDVVTNLVVAKSFAPNSPSNSSGGSIDIQTIMYPEAFEFKLSVGGGFEGGSQDRFLELETLSPVAEEAEGRDALETDLGGSLGGRFEFADREFRFRALANHEVDYRTAEGFRESREPSRPVTRRTRAGEVVIAPGDLALGQLSRSSGRFDQTLSVREEQLTLFAGLGTDLDDEGDHRLDFTFFFTDKQNENIDLRENGFIPGGDYELLRQGTIDDELERDINTFGSAAATIGTPLGNFGPLRELVDDSPDRGALWFASFGSSGSFDRERDLALYQLNGEHDFDLLEGLKVTWAANHARTTQSDVVRGTRFTFEPCGFESGNPCPTGVTRIDLPTVFPVAVSDLGPGSYYFTGAQGGLLKTDTDIDEVQWFARLDTEQKILVAEVANLDIRGGLWFETAKREVEASFAETFADVTLSQFQRSAADLQGLGSAFREFAVNPGVADRFSESEFSREIMAGYLDAKATLFEDIDILGGLRIERIFIDSDQSPFTGEQRFANRPAIFPSAYIFFDRLDNPNRDGNGGGLGEDASPVPDGFVFNDQVLGIDVPRNPLTGFVDLLTREQILSVVNGEIDETKLLPSVGLAYRPVDGLTLRASYAQTVARPSFREIGYYVTVEPGSGDQIVGNPQLQLSDVESYDFRAEYLYGDLGDLFAFSFFYKEIEDPIEGIFVRDALNFEGDSSALFRTFFNNQNTADLWGIEVEARKSIDFLPALGLQFPGVDVFDYLSFGGNFTYIDAEVARSSEEVRRAQELFAVPDGDTAQFAGLASKRRLFGQPEWIANADVTFDHPDWGTTATLAWFAISDVLDTAGTSLQGPNRRVERATLDRYLDSFDQLDLVVSQQIWRGLKAKMSIKNLTDSKRRRFYDEGQTTSRVIERELRTGRDWSFGLSYTHEFGTD